MPRGKPEQAEQIIPKLREVEVELGRFGDSLKVKVKTPPEKGQLNDAVIALLADCLGIDASSIAVVSGHGSPAQVVAVDGMNDEAIQQAFPSEKPGKSGGTRRRE